MAYRGKRMESKMTLGLPLICAPRVTTFIGSDFSWPNKSRATWLGLTDGIHGGTGLAATVSVEHVRRSVKLPVRGDHARGNRRVIRHPVMERDERIETPTTIALAAFHLFEKFDDELVFDTDATIGPIKPSGNRRARQARRRPRMGKVV